MKRFKMTYNPYTNRICFKVAETTDDNGASIWNDLPNESRFMEFQNEKCVFENCVERILTLINTYINTTDSLEIVFVGTIEDFDVLQNAVFSSQDPRAKSISCLHLKTYPSASTALSSIKRSFSKIKKEFDDYIDSDDADKKEIGDAVMKYMDTVKPEIPICVIGNYSVGKSALINAFIGREILPSKANPTTATNAVIRNDKKYKVVFYYQEEEYEISFKGKKYKVVRPSEPDNNLVNSLFKGADTLSNEQEIIHFILDKINNANDTEDPVSHIDNCISVYVPFHNSRLNFDDYSFCFIDTPGSNNGEEKSHRATLEELMMDQTNALPLVVATRGSLASNDSFDLRELLTVMEDGFSKQNCIIAISMSDELVSTQIKEDIPDSVREGVSDPTIMYVSPVAAIGVRKDNSVEWIDQTYKEIFESKVSALLKTQPPDYNMTPCKRSLSKEDKESLDPLSYASGLPSLEQELNYFAMRFAEYKKCTKGKELLLNAMEMANIKLEEAKNQLEKDKEDKKKEQQAVRSAIVGKMKQVKTPTVNVAVNSVKSQFQSVLNDYCKSVPSVVREYWKNVYKKQYTIDDLGKDMQIHCQNNLYNPNANGIKALLQDKLIEQASLYMKNVQACVTDQYEKISVDAQKELDALFDTVTQKPQLNDVEIRPFVRIRLGFLKWIGNIFSTEDQVVSTYSNEFIAKLKGNERQHGLFAVQCIQEPANAYSKQINQWANKQIIEVQKTLNHDNAILSDLDDKIAELEQDIIDLEGRLTKLSNVSNSLKSLLPEDKQNDE